MAAPMMLSFKSLQYISLRFNLLRPSVKKQYFARYKSITAAKDINTYEPYYPKIKPELPDGNWEEVDKKLAWELHDEAVDLKKIKNIKDRLENISGSNNKKMYEFNGIERKACLIKYKQFLTKTHIHECEDDMKEIYQNNKFTFDLSSSDKVSVASELLKSRILQAKQVMSSEDVLKTIYKNYFRSLVSLLMRNCSHLEMCQCDENVRVESFWKGGNNIDNNFQIITRISQQIRIEQPLAEIISMEDPLCKEGEVPAWDYDPVRCGGIEKQRRPITMSGHWIGDPCEYTLLSILHMQEEYKALVEEYGEVEAFAELPHVALNHCFASALSQAYNQGFNEYFDVTYPFISQLIMTDGKWIQFFFYQLNTLHTWKPNKANPLRNILFVGPRMQLYEETKDGNDIKMNLDAVKQIVRMLAVQPADMSIQERRPYDCEQKDWSSVDCYIANKGDVQLPQFKPGQHELPKNAVYY